MARIIFPKGKQSEWINNILLKEDVSTGYLSKICNISDRTVRDWKREKFTISRQALIKLCNHFKLKYPLRVSERSDYWYTLKGASKGALRRQELYGPLGTLQGRKKGGINSQLKRKENPEKYKLLGCVVRKEFSLSGKYSVDLAEAVGIILGDGAITTYQVRITVSGKVDREYAEFICSLFQKVFNDRPTWIDRKDNNTILLTISGIGLVEELEKLGLLKGDKVKNQIGFPKWIWKDIEYQKACIRGLMDTDGGCFFHKHVSNGLTYNNFGMCFTNMSLPILLSVAKVLKSLGLKVYIIRNKRIYIYSLEEIKKYFSLIGSHNSKNNKKFSYYMNQANHRV